jgi:hypothetical protein
MHTALLNDDVSESACKLINYILGNCGSVVLLLIIVLCIYLGRYIHSTNLAETSRAEEARVVSRLNLSGTF